jgi:hypothetical protein
MPRALLVYPNVRHGDRMQNCSEVIKFRSKLVSRDRLINVKWPELVAELNVRNHIALLAPHFIMQYPVGLNRKGNNTSVKVKTKQVTWRNIKIEVIRKQQAVSCLL